MAAKKKPKKAAKKTPKRKATRVEPTETVVIRMMLKNIPVTDAIKIREGVSLAVTSVLGAKRLAVTSGLTFELRSTLKEVVEKAEEDMPNTD